MLTQSPRTTEPYTSSYHDIVQTLRGFEHQCKGNLVRLGSNGLVGFDAGRNLFLTAVHHGSEIFGTYKSVLRAIDSDLPVSAVPVAGIETFEAAMREVQGIQKYLEPKGEEIIGLHEMMAGYNGKVNPPKELRPGWHVYSYGQQDQPDYVADIEGLALKCSAIVDLHNTPRLNNAYIIIATPGNTGKQYEAEQAIKDVIMENNLSFVSGQGLQGYTEVRPGIYVRNTDGQTILDFAHQNGMVGFAFEVPAFFLDGTKIQMCDQEQIVATNVEIFARIAEIFVSD